MLPAVFDELEAGGEGAPVIHDESDTTDIAEREHNLVHHIYAQRGDVDAARRGAAAPAAAGSSASGSTAGDARALLAAIPDAERRALFEAATSSAATAGPRAPSASSARTGSTGSCTRACQARVP